MNNVHKSISVLYASDDNFAEVLGISICSLIKNSNTFLNIYVVDQGISDINKQKLISLTKEKNCKLLFLTMPDFSTIVGQEIDISRYSMSMFSRLMVATLLPDDVGRVVYLDCDTMVLNDLSELYEFDLVGCTVGAVNDLRSSRYSRNLGIGEKHCYVNSGVLLIDLKQYRLRDYEKKFIQALGLYNGLLEFPDNDLICMLMADDLVLIPPKYNAYSIFYACEYDELHCMRYPAVMPSQEEYQEARENPTVVHFTTCVFFKNRPWNDISTHPRTEEYLMYRSNSPWSDDELRKTQATRMKKLQAYLIEICPRAIALRLFGFAHSFVKPNIQYFTKKRYLDIFPFVIDDKE